MRQGFIGAPTAAGGSKNKGVGAGWSLKWGEGGDGHMGQVGGVAEMACPPLGSAMCRDHAQYPAFSPCTSECVVGLCPFCILFINDPNCTCTQLCLVSYSFLVFCS